MSLQVSTKGRYGVRAMLELAGREAVEPVSIKSIAEAQDLSVDYLEQIFHKLRQAGLVRSVRGPGGGFELARDPKDISIAEIVRALEGPISAVWCVGAPANDGCVKADGCAVRELWCRLTDSMDEVLSGTALADLLPAACPPARKGGAHGENVPRS